APARPASARSTRCSCPKPRPTASTGTNCCLSSSQVASCSERSPRLVEKPDAQKEVTTVSKNQILFWIGVAVTAAAWINFAEHPTVRNLKRAIIDTLEL